MFSASLILYLSIEGIASCRAWHGPDITKRPGVAYEVVPGSKPRQGYDAEVFVGSVYLNSEKTLQLEDSLVLSFLYHADSLATAYHLNGGHNLFLRMERCLIPLSHSIILRITIQSTLTITIMALSANAARALEQVKMVSSHNLDSSCSQLTGSRAYICSTELPTSQKTNGSRSIA
jgi:hypothetical protein